jgi:ligand-binding SRPBCC domain-containing protein
MPRIRVDTTIAAPPEVCFDLALHVDAHQASIAGSQERAVAGITSGRMTLGDEVTWEAVHFGVRQRLTARITEHERPHHFVDEMVSGAFARFRHLHAFERMDGSTRMLDEFDYTSPLGWLGTVADRLFLERYMRRLLTERAGYLKRAAEAWGR